VEVKLRSQAAREVIPLEQVVTHAKQVLEGLHQDLQAAAVPVSYRE